MAATRKTAAVKYFSLRPIKKMGRTFNFIFGGRGIGKTFNSIRECREDSEKFIYMRRTQNECELICDYSDDMELSPFAKINHETQKDENTMQPRFFEIHKANKNVWSVYDRVALENETDVEMVGACMALSTVANLRGFDADWADVLLLDEFVPERHVKKIGKGDLEGTAILNAYETINRDREMKGRKPLQCFFMSNANDISHPLLSILGIIPIMERMRIRGTTFSDFPERSMTITLYDDAEFKTAKAQTALYKLTKGTEFYQMAIENDFVYNDFSFIKSMNLIEYRPWCKIGKVTIYKHKSSGLFYVSGHSMKCKTYADNEHGRASFMLDRGRTIYAAFINGHLFFENYELKKYIMELII